MHNDLNLLEALTRSVGEYARTLMKILYKPEEVRSGLLASQQSKRFEKEELDHERFHRLNGKK
jgi:hypothetical protein